MVAGVSPRRSKPRSSPVHNKSPGLEETILRQRREAPLASWALISMQDAIQMKSDEADGFHEACLARGSVDIRWTVVVSHYHYYVWNPSCGKSKNDTHRRRVKHGKKAARKMDVSKSRGCQHRNTGRSLPSGIAPTTPRDERTTGGRRMCGFLSGGCHDRRGGPAAVRPWCAQPCACLCAWCVGVGGSCDDNTTRQRHETN